MRTKGKTGIATKDPEGKSDYQKLAEEIIYPEAQERKIIKRIERKTGETIPWHKLSDKQKRKVRKSESYRKAAAHFQRQIAEASGHPRNASKIDASGKRLEPELRKAMKMPPPPKHPYVALMEPMVIVPDTPDEKVVVADAGTIVRLMDQATLYRDRVSPVTRRADELMAQYGSPGKLKIGWLTNKQPPKILKPSKGPTFLVTTKSEDALVAWEQMRLLVARTRKSDPTNWIAPWLANHGAKHPKLLREVTRYFGGKPIKNEPFEERCARLFQLILSVELDMATAKTSKSKKVSKKSKKQKAEVEEAPTKKSKKDKASKKEKSKKAKSDPARITKADDDRVIVRLVKENPRKAGTKKAKIWDRIKKGMTVGEFAAKESRAHIGYLIKNGWIKLKKAE